MREDSSRRSERRSEEARGGERRRESPHCAVSSVIELLPLKDTEVVVQVPDYISPPTRSADGT